MQIEGFAPGKLEALQEKVLISLKIFSYLTISGYLRWQASWHGSLSQREQQSAQTADPSRRIQKSEAAKR